IRWVAWAATVFAGATMVSNIKFYSFKDINLRKSVPFWAILAVVLFLVLVSIFPPGVLFGLFAAYAISGYVFWIRDYRKRRSLAAEQPLQRDL
ncbi:MAG: CDP-diacylglycerol--serine O-phosphatidyltransferase, partial [Burkholderiales bacterium]